MMRRLPVVPTLLVLAAVATMIALGVWQLQRATWKEHLLARYGQAERDGSAVAYPFASEQQEAALYHHSSVYCRRVIAQSAMAGRNAAHQAGVAQIARCATPDGEAEVALGWSRDPAIPAWNGGTVQGIVGPAGHGVRLVAAPPQAGLTQLASPDPRDIPNNHRSYAVQWFFFAATALVIYILALRRKLGSDGK